MFQEKLSFTNFFKNKNNLQVRLIYIFQYIYVKNDRCSSSQESTILSSSRAFLDFNQNSRVIMPRRTKSLHNKIDCVH